MPWIAKESYSPRSRFERRIRRWLYDHSQGLTAAAIGAACVLGALGALKAAGLLG